MGSQFSQLLEVIRGSAALAGANSNVHADTLLGILQMTLGVGGTGERQKTFGIT